MNLAPTPARPVWRCGGVLVLAAAAMAACGGGDQGPPGPGGLATLLTTSLEPASDRCLSGGVRIQSGLDEDQDGVLQQAEATQSQVVCNGAAAVPAAAGLNSLVVLAAEPAGAHCLAGGTRIQVGLDTNANGALEAAEVSSTAYVCGGLPGATGPVGPAGPVGLNRLMKMTPTAAAGQCASGGQMIEVGLDANRNGVLDASEAVLDSYVCNGSDGATGPAGDTGPTGPGLSWSEAAANLTMAGNHGYMATGATEVRLTLPSSPRVGELFKVTGAGSGGWRVLTSGQQVIQTGALKADHLNPGQTLKQVLTVSSMAPVAVSQDGSIVVAPEGGGRIHVSSNGGETWTQTGPTKTWDSVAMSPSASVVIAGVRSSTGLWKSTDFGTTWTEINATAHPLGLAVDSTGSIMMVADDRAGQVLRSTDGGASFAVSLPLPNAASVGMSTNGMTLAAVASGSAIHRSLNGGTTWEAVASVRTWRAVSVSADGSRMAAVDGQNVWISTDSGANWTRGASIWGGEDLAMSADGMTQMVASSSVPHAGVHTSTDGGVTWSMNAERTGSWAYVGVSADGRKGFASLPGSVHVSVGGRTSSNGGGVGGSQYDSLSLQYVGSDVFVPVQHSNYDGRFKVY